MKPATEEQKAVAKAKREKFPALAKQISAMTPEERSALASRLPGLVTVDGRQLSPFNVCLIVSQGGHAATMVGGFRQWLKHGRAVKKGQHGFSIWVPSITKSTLPRNDSSDETTAKKIEFLTGYVFDVAQTEEITKQQEAA